MVSNTIPSRNLTSDIVVRIGKRGGNRQVNGREARKGPREAGGEDYKKVYKEGDRETSQLVGRAVKRGYTIVIIVIMHEIALIRTF